MDHLLSNFINMWANVYILDPLPVYPPIGPKSYSKTQQKHSQTRAQIPSAHFRRVFGLDVYSKEWRLLRAGSVYRGTTGDSFITRESWGFVRDSTRVLKSLLVRNYGLKCGERQQFSVKRLFLITNRAVWFKTNEKYQKYKKLL